MNLRIATSETWKDKASGERKEKTEWHSVVIFNENLARVAEQYLKKGSKVYLEGQLQTRKWTDQQGVEKYSTEVVLQRFRGELTILDSRGGGGVRVWRGGAGPGPKRRRLRTLLPHGAQARARRQPRATATSTTTSRSDDPLSELSRFPKIRASAPGFFDPLRCRILKHRRRPSSPRFGSVAPAPSRAACAPSPAVPPGSATTNPGSARSSGSSSVRDGLVPIDLLQGRHPPAGPDIAGRVRSAYAGRASSVPAS